MEAQMARVLYGGGNGHRRPPQPITGRTNDGRLGCAAPLAEGDGWQEGGTNPEQLFAVGYAACFESALGVVGRRERAEVGDVSIDSRVSLLPPRSVVSSLAVGARRNSAAGSRSRAGERGSSPPPHQVCPYSNATRGNIDVTLTANGHDV